jgi:hypothetical protein
MNREDITRIAREVGFSDGEINTCQLMFERFAKLVAQHERERCAKLRDDLHFYHFDKTASVSKTELVACVEQALDDLAKLIRTGNV